MKKFWKVLTVVGLLVLVFGVATVFAEGIPIPYREGPPGVLMWEYDGNLFVTDYRDGEPFTQRFCDCDDNNCNVIVQEDVTKETPKPTPDPTPIPTEKPEKVKCNSGGGNGSEGDPECDPGNSGSHNNAGD